MKLLRRHTAYQRKVFLLQLWTLKKFSEPRISLNDGSKEVENGETWTFSCADGIMSTLVCAVRNVSCAVTYCAISRAPTWTLDAGVRYNFN